MPNQSKRPWLFVFLILTAAALRLVPHLPNFTPISAMALLGGSFFAVGSRSQWVRNLLMATALPLCALVLSDAVLGFSTQTVSVYVSFALVALLGFWKLEKRTAGTVGLAAVSGSVLFFVVTNFAVWAEGVLYSRDFNGLIDCYLMALPFLRSALAGDLFYAAVLFGAWAFAEKFVPQAKAA